MNREELIQNIVENLAKCQRPALNAAWKQLGLSHAQMGVLYLLFYHNNTSAKQAADFLSISKSAVTQLMDPLVDKGLVSRRSDSKDRRVVRLELTPSGLQALKKLAKHKYAGLRSGLESLSDKELADLHKLHAKIAANI